MRAIARCIAAAVAAIAIPAAFAAWPERPVKIVVAAGAGSASDVRSRWIAAQLGERLGQSVIVENQAGGSGTIGSRNVARSAPDGYTLLLAHLGNMVMAPHVNENIGYDPVTDFVPVARLTGGYAVLTCSQQFPARTVAELVKIGKDKPGSINWGNTGVGAPPWMLGELFRKTAGIEITQVQYKGGGELLTDLIGGRIDCWMEGLNVQVPHIKAGRIRALAVTSPQRLDPLPEVPTMAEAGLPDFKFQGWMGIVAPAGTPRPVVEKLNGLIRSILATPEARQVLADQGAFPVFESPEEFAAFIGAERQKWVPLVRTVAIAR
jgi:tripartite-type tricarboxylate transporter receptor subunit TctC